jgi:hypothetical protein
MNGEKKYFTILDGVLKNDLLEITSLSIEVPKEEKMKAS